MQNIPNHERKHAPLERSFEKLLTPFEIFFKSQSTTGVVLLAATLLALLLANSGYRDVYETINHLPLSISLGEWRISASLRHWVNEGLMVLFFFVLGLEVKRECLVGGLRDFRRSSLVVWMALGGMLAPAGVYTWLVGTGDEAARGWGIPMATDTAFALGILALLGRFAPKSAALILSALAIVDDIGAVLVISVFYTREFDLNALWWAAATLSMLFFFTLVGLRKPLFYLVGGVVMWWFILHSGVHAATAGVVAALAVPTRPYAGTGWFLRRMRRLISRFEEADEPDRSILEQTQQHTLAEQAQQIAIETTTPLQHWGTKLDKPVSLAIVPLFAFLNAGITLPQNPMQILNSPVTLGTAAGLIFGKAVGIFSFAWMGVRSGVAELPDDLNFAHIAALSLLAGIGFTMSLFIAALAFEQHPELLMQAKLGILIGSLIAGLAGAGLFSATYYSRRASGG